MLGRFEWDVLPADPKRATALARRCGIDPLIAQLLINRRITEPVDVQRFLSPSLEALDDPLNLPDMRRAVATIRNAIIAKGSILVFGDADADGITASAVVYELLTELARPGNGQKRACHDLSHSKVGDGGAHVVVRLSNRLEDGYGFPKRLIKQLIRSGITLLILLDCGTNQSEEIRVLSDHGIETIVLDHHLPSKEMARPLALVNPYRGDRCGRELCSAGLALKLAQAMWPGEPDQLTPYLDLVALGTLADYAPLLGENRMLVSAGTERILKTQRPGLAQLCESVKLTKPTPEQILQRLVPRLNATARLGNPWPAWKLLVEPSARAAQRLVTTLKEAHDTTKALTRQMLSEAYEQANRLHFKDQFVMVIGRRGWHPGLMGPLASQLVERYARPAIAIALDDRVGVGSGRSTPMFDLFEALRACEGTLLRYGGHRQACGLTISSANLERFQEQINRHAQGSLGRHNLARTRSIDAELTLGDVSPYLVTTLERFKPFGPGNPRPQFLVRNVGLDTDTQGRSWVTDTTARVKVRGRLLGRLPTERYDVVVNPVLVEEGLGLSIGDARLHVPSRKATALS